MEGGWEDVKEPVWAHVCLTGDVSEVWVIHKEDRLLTPLAGHVVLRPQECVMIIPPFKWAGNEIQHIASVYQMRDVLMVVSTRHEGEFSVKIFNTSKEAKMLSQKFAMVGVHMYEVRKVTWDTKVAETKPMGIEATKKLHR